MTSTRLQCPVGKPTAIPLQQSRDISNFTPIRSMAAATPHSIRQAIKSGDIVDVGNGLSILVQQADANHALVDLCLGGKRLDVFPIKVEQNYCAEHHGVSLSLNGSVLVVDPVYNNFINSPLDIYTACMRSGTPHSNCVDFIGYTPAPTERLQKKGKFQVITPSDANPIIGAYFLQQVQLSYRQIQKYFGFSEVTPLISLRWLRADKGWAVPNTTEQVKMFPASPGTEASEVEWIQNNQNGKIATIAGSDIIIHELTHLLFYGMSFPYYMGEGLARFAEVHITQRPNPIAKWDKTIPFNTSIPVSDLVRPLQFTTRGQNSLGQAVVFSPSLQQWFTEKSHHMLESGKMLTVETFTKRGVSVRLFDNVQFDRQHGWILQYWVECLEDGYLEQLAILTGKAHYVGSQKTEAGEFTKNPYASLSKGPRNPGSNGELYDTAYCMYEGVQQMYGKRVMHDFLAKADKVRQDNLNGIPTQFCATHELEVAAHHDLTNYLRRFDPPRTCFSTFARPPLLKGVRYCPDSGQ